MANNTISAEELERLFDVYISTDISPATGMPSINNLSETVHRSRASLTRMRDENGWETRRKAILVKSAQKLDNTRAAKRAKKRELVSNLDNAGLNHLAGKVKGGKLKVSVSEGIALGKYLLLLDGEPDSRPDIPGQNSDINIVLKSMPIDELLELVQEGLRAVKKSKGDKQDEN